MTFEDQGNALSHFPLQEHSSGRHLQQKLIEDEFVQNINAPEAGSEKGGFFETINARGLPQLMEVVEALYIQAIRALPCNMSIKGLEVLRL